MSLSGNCSSAFGQTTTSDGQEEMMKRDEVGHFGQNDVSTDFEDEQKEEEAEEKEVFLSLFWSDDKLGAAVYDVLSKKVRVLSEQPDGPPFFEALKNVIKQIEPTLLLISHKNADKLLPSAKESMKKRDTPVSASLLRPGAASGASTSSGAGTSQSAKRRRRRSGGSTSIGENDEDGDEEMLVSNNILALPDNYYYVEASKKRILFTDLPGIPHSLDANQKLLRFSSFINFSETVSVRSLGALLKFLDTRRVGVQLECDDTQVPILSINYFFLEDVVHLNGNTTEALQIVAEEPHPSVYKRGFGKKEGLSILGLFNKCSSRPGSSLLRRLFLRPSRQAAVIRYRLDTVQFFADNSNIEMRDTIKKTLRGVRYVSTILGRMRVAQASVNDWSTFYKTLYNVIQVGETIRLHSEPHVLVEKVDQIYTMKLVQLCNSIAAIVDFSKSLSTGYFEVLDGYDKELDHKKGIYASLPDQLSSAAAKEKKRLEGHVDVSGVIYLPQIGFLMEVRPTSEDWDPSSLHYLPDLSYVFVSKGFFYFRSGLTTHMDSAFGDIFYEISDRQVEIMHRLQDEILVLSEELDPVLYFCAELDCLISMSEVAGENGYTRPCFNNEKYIEVKGGRHPLQELCVQTFVPNDYRSGRGSAKAKIITGPNSSGKSIYLKQVCLIVYLAHVGSFVPAEYANIPVIDKLFTRIRTIESIATNASTFLCDLNQMALALNEATGDSLVAVDEFGKGTHPQDGVGLLAAATRYWLKRMESQSPHLLISTHFHAVSSLLPDTRVVEYNKMSVNESDDDVTYLFKLSQGIVSSSIAHHVAAMAGIPQATIHRSKDVTARLAAREPLQAQISEKLGTVMDKYFTRADTLIGLDIESPSTDFMAFLSNIH